MALGIAAMAKLLGQLTILIPATDSLVKSLGEAVARARQDPSTGNRLDELEKAVRLQVEVSQSLTDQLHIVRSLLTGVQRSLRIFSYTLLITALLSLAAITLALWK